MNSKNKNMINVPKNVDTKTVRMDKYLASLGMAARRNITDILRSKLITINGKKVLEPGIRFDPGKDRLLIDGEQITKPEYVYIMLHKPKNVISTASDEMGRKTVVSLVQSKKRLFPVGRLDQDTTGLLLLTNDGELANRLTHPRYHIPKRYELVIVGKVSLQKLQQFKKGVKLEDGMTAPAQAEILKQEEKKTILEVVLHQGKKRQIRRMCERLHLPLLELKRVAMGSIVLENLPVGKYRDLTQEELDLLKKEAYQDISTDYRFSK